MKPYFRSIIVGLSCFPDAIAAIATMWSFYMNSRNYSLRGIFFRFLVTFAISFLAIAFFVLALFGYAAEMEDLFKNTSNAGYDK